MECNLRMALVVGSVALTAGFLVLGGTMYNVVCTNQGCGYKVDLGLGGTMLYAAKTGWCVNCKDFVAVGWTRPDARGLPAEKTVPEVKPVGTIWLPMTGQVKPLYPCPKCKQPFLPIDSIEELKCCPKCNKPTIRARAGILYD
ncbi:MAG TPA: hypothetical protein VNE39_20080 [Planctomycetota bacterium]|nr:hypothetical protein [Planctomycetota bacterium]